MSAAGTLAGELHGLLGGTGRYSALRRRAPWGRLALALALFGFAYGAAMGSFGGRGLQCLYSGLKVPLLLLCTTAVCLPNFYVVNTLLGLREDFAAALRGVLAAQSIVAVALAGLAPVTLFGYVSSRDYVFAVVINGVYFAIATVAGQIALSRYYRPLVAARPRHRIGRAAWTVLYVFVAIQLAWVLRPFVGAPGLEVRFFREDAWSNAYVIVFRDVWALLFDSAPY